MDRILEFAASHWMLVTGTVAVIIALIVNEAYMVARSGTSVDPTAATRLYNQEDAVFIDLRDENSYHKRHLPGAINVPEKHLGQRQDYLAGYAGRPAILYVDGPRSLGQAMGQVEGAGLSPVYQLRGGLAAWREANLPTEGRG